MSIKAIIKNKEYTFENIKDLTVSKVFKELNLIPETYLCIRNGELVTEQELLKDGDTVRFVPVISGG